MNAARECLLPTAYSYITRSFSAYIAIIIAIILARPFTSLSRTVIIMVSLVEIIIALFATFGQLALGSSPTRGFPNLEEVQGNGSLLSKYSTHDGELRSVPSGQSNCSTGQGSITEIAFIALPGVGYDSIELVINSSNSVVSTVNLSGAIQSFGTFGYELVLPEANRIAFNSGDVLWLYLPYHNESRLRLLYQTVPVPLNTCWRYIEEVSGDIKCGDYHDYPLLAFETAPPGCLDDLLNMNQLRRMWESRAAPVLYSSPQRELTLNCNNTGYLSKVLVGVYDETGVADLQFSRARHPLCNHSTFHATEQFNVFECILNPPIEIDENDSLYIEQRYSSKRIAFLHDGQMDTPLISLNLSGECDSSEFLSEQNLKDKAAHLIPNQIQVEDDVIIYQHLNITQDGRVVKWTFAAEDQGVGWKGPVMRIYRFEEGQENLFDFSSIQGSDAVATTYPNVYEITVDPPVAVYAGYFVGLELPPIDSVKLLLSFILNDSPPGVSIVNGDDVEGLPLIILEIESSPVTDSLPPSSLSPTYHLQSPSITSSRLQLSSTSSIRLQFPSVTGFRHPTPLTPVLSAPSIVSSCIPTQTMCSGGNEDDNITIIGTIALICLLLISVVTITIITLLWRRRRQGKSNLVDNVAYNCHECEIKENKMATSHGVKEVSMNADYEYILSTPKQDPVNIATSTNDAYNITNFHAVVTDVNVAYGATCTSPRFTESTTQDIPTSANEAYITTDISISDNPAYVAVTAITDDTLENNTCLPSRPRESAQDIPTSPNEAYITTDISTTDNPAYIAVTDDNLEYDYI